LQFVKNSDHASVIIMDIPHRLIWEPLHVFNKEVNAFNKKLNKIIRLYDHTSKLNLNMQKEHFTKHGMLMNVSGTDRISGLLTSRIMELFTTHHSGTPNALPWKGETKEEEEKQMRPVVEEFKFISPEGKHSSSVKQDGVKVQHVDFNSANNAEHSILGKMSSKSDILCKDSDNSTKPLQITQDHKQTNKHKRTTKIPKTRSHDFLWT